MSHLAHNHDIGPESNSSCQEYTINDFNNEFEANSDNFMILNQNIRSFSSNFDEFSVFLNELNSKFAVIVLTETWFSTCNIQNIPNYTGYHSARSSKSGGGVSIYVHNNFNSSLTPSLTLCDSNIESCGVKIRTGNGLAHLNVVGIYRPPDSDAISFSNLLNTEILL